jgi:4-hydroxybutyryl-CoA dehydratase/vinylacetyl-CoA-Delta-isomerase
MEYLSGAIDGESRIRAARLVEWLTIGAGVPGCMHGGGSPDGAKLMVRGTSDWDGSAELARILAGIKDPIPEPSKGK